MKFINSVHTLLIWNFYSSRHEPFSTKLVSCILHVWPAYGKAPFGIFKLMVFFLNVISLYSMPA